MGDNDIMLPEGKTCKDCKHYHRCGQFINIDGDEIQCDFSPSRFALSEKELVKGECLRIAREARDNMEYSTDQYILDAALDKIRAL